MLAPTYLTELAVTRQEPTHKREFYLHTTNLQSSAIGVSPPLPQKAAASGDADRE